MALQDSFRHAWRGSRLREAQLRRREVQRKLNRRSLLETLEGRQLMAVGPQLVGIEPNNGTLLTDGMILNQSPSELTLRFSDTQALDPEGFDAIRITRSGGDGFALARAATDFGTQGQVIVEFVATASGAAGNGTQLVFTTADRGTTSSAPGITRVGNTMNIVLNRNAAAPTRVQDLETALEVGANAGFVNLNLVQGVNFARLDQAIPTAGLTVSLVAADRAQVVTSLSASGVQVRIAARASGAAGQGIVVNVRAEDRGVGGLPSVDSVTGNTISVRINSRAGSQTTVQQFVNALQQNPAANQLVETRLEAGNPNALVGNIDLFAPISLTGGVALADEQIVPGYVGLGDSAGEVVLRFSQPLSQDTYRIEILGQGADPFRNINNQPLNGGNNYALTFSVNRAPQVLSVVPQPIVVESGVRKQRTNEVWVYFDRNDPLDVATANNVNNYSLYFGNNGVLTPTSVPTTRRRALRFCDLRMICPR